MKQREWYLLALLPFISVFHLGCHPEVDVYAPAKEMYGVYGVLDPALDTQYVRIGKLFQVEGDAYDYSNQYDLSADDLLVTLEGGDSTYSSFLQLEATKDSGLFHPGLSVYGIETRDGGSLKPGSMYTLHVRHRDDDLLDISATTRVPFNPRIVAPGPYIYNTASRTYTYNTVEFNEDVSLTLEKNADEGYEWRIYVKYWDGEKIDEYRWGPSRIRFESDGCPGSGNYNRTCFRIAEQLMPSSFAAHVSQTPGIPYMVDTVRLAHSLAELSKDTRLELTVVDNHLAKYLNGATPFGFGLNLLLDKRDYTNISGGNTGIFGAVQRRTHYIFLGECTVFRAGLSLNPPFNCQ
jgi:hypothetical protein